MGQIQGKLRDSQHMKGVAIDLAKGAARGLAAAPLQIGRHVAETVAEKARQRLRDALIGRPG